MRKRWFLIGGAAVVVVAVALYLGLVVYPAARFRTALRAAEQFLPAGTSLHYRTADYSLFSGRATLRGVTLGGTGPLASNVTIDTLELDHPSLDLAKDWQRAAADPTALAPTASLPVATAITGTRIVIHAQNMRETIGSLHVEELRVYPWALLHPGVPSWAEVQAMLAARPPPQSLAAVMPLFHFIAACALGVGYTRLSTEDIASTTDVPATSNRPAQHISSRVASTDGSGNDRGVFGPGTAEHMAFEFGALAGTFSIDRATAAGLDVQKPLTQLLGATTLTPAMLDGLAIGRFELAGMALKPPAGGPIALGTFALSKIAFSHGLPVSAALAWNGLHLTRAEIPNPKAQLVFSALGLDAMTISLDAAYDWDLTQNSVSLHDFLFKVAELGSLNLSASLTNVTPTRDGAAEARLAHARLRYTDASLVERALGAAAAADHVDPTAFRQELVAMVQSRSAEFEDSPALAQAAKAILAFLGTPHSLTAELSPPTPVPIATLRTAETMSPPDLASLLGLAVTANQ